MVGGRVLPASVCALLCLAVWANVAHAGVNVGPSNEAPAHSAVTAANSTAPEFSLERGDQLLFLAYSAFCPAEDLHHWNCTWCGKNENVAFVNDFRSSLWEGNMYGFVSYSKEDKAIYVTFRGSHGLMTWLYNFRAYKTKYPACEGCEVHTGFHSGFTAVRDEVHQHIAKARTDCPKCDRIYVTGHSLGGALATLCAMDLVVDEKYKDLPITLYTFGGPRVGNKAFATFTHEKLSPTGLFRVTHRADPVPHLPPTYLSFVHPPTEIFVAGEDDKYVHCDDAQVGKEDPKCASQYLLLKPLDHALYLGWNILSKIDGKEPCETVKWVPNPPPPPQEQAAAPADIPSWAIDRMEDPTLFGLPPRPSAGVRGANPVPIV